MFLEQNYDDPYSSPDNGSFDPYNPNGPGPVAPNPGPGTPPPPGAPLQINSMGVFGQPLHQGGGGNGGGGGGGIGNSFGDYNFSPIPEFKYPEFVRPDAKSILSAPGYLARQQAGESALQRSAASKGLLRSGGTLKDLVEYGQNFASNEYNNEFNQAYQTYGANYQNAKDRYAPLLAQWDMLSKAEIQRMLASYNRGTIWNNPNAGGGGGGGSSEGLIPYSQF